MSEPTEKVDPALGHAYHLCKKYGFLFFTEVSDRVFDRKADRWVQLRRWVVYQAAPAGARPIRLGKCSTPDRLLAFVKRQIRKVESTHATPA